LGEFLSGLNTSSSLAQITTSISKPTLTPTPEVTPASTSMEVEIPARMTGAGTI
ncbi:hypothetical protein ACH5RR_036998, partial [Cinchona calisaya]